MFPLWPKQTWHEGAWNQWEKKKTKLWTGGASVQTTRIQSGPLISCGFPKFSGSYHHTGTNTGELWTLRCFWQMRELSHLLTCGGVEERPGREGALSTSLSRRWIAHAAVIHHRGGKGAWLDVQSPRYPLKPKSESDTPIELPASFSPPTRTCSSQDYPPV